MRLVSLKGNTIPINQHFYLTGFGHRFESRLEIKSHLKSSPAMSLEIFWKFDKIWEMTDKAIKVRKFWFVKHSSKATFL